ncbi:NAD(P)/FAD-dependent oxidoreductase [Xylanimonas sp. McL0601]|uniref:NAD(P)/FAD-dependent oxidoreductase n=1 Tax=Xylanimonas sp. McL0601 TaxID=3414739 RepID=UPI003CECC93D
MAEKHTPEIVIVGSGFAGFFAARRLAQRLPAGAANVTVVSTADHLCYSPLLPEVAAGSLDAQRIAVPLHGALGQARVVHGLVDDVDFDARTVRVSGATDVPFTLPWDRLVLTTGSVTRVLPTPGLREHALGLKTLLEAQYVHDHVLRQLECADTTTDEAERAARLTFVVVGAGYAGTETAAQLQCLTDRLISRFPRLAGSRPRWMLLDLSPTVLPELGPRLGRYALKVLRARGMQVRLGVSVASMSDDGIVLSDGSKVATRTVLWTVGVTPPPLVERLGLPVERGRLVVDGQLRVRDDVWAAGDSAGTPNPYADASTAYPPTAQHAQRQGVVIADNVAASLGFGTAREYKHHDLGLVADLGGRWAVARPLGVPLTGLPAKVVAKGYHLYAIPSMAARARIAADWVLGLVHRPAATQLDLVRPEQAQIAAAQHTQEFTPTER